jgi:hypothetical protein
LTNIGELMRSVLVSLLVGALMCVTFAAPALASHRPHSHCTEDLCATTFRGDDGARKFRIDTFAFDHYTLCVWKAGTDAKHCERFEAEDDKGIYRDTVRWLRHFPYQGPGAYNFVYKSYGNRVTPVLGFHDAEAPATG